MVLRILYGGSDHNVSEAHLKLTLDKASHLGFNMVIMATKKANVSTLRAEQTATGTNAMPNTLIMPVIYGWDDGSTGTKNTPQCKAAREASKTDPTCPDHVNGCDRSPYCFNMIILDVIKHFQVDKQQQISITQLSTYVPKDWITNSNNYPVSSTCSNSYLACAIGNIPLPTSCPRPQFSFNINQV